MFDANASNFLWNLNQVNLHIGKFIEKSDLTVLKATRTLENRQHRFIRDSTHGYLCQQLAAAKVNSENKFTQIFTETP